MNNVPIRKANRLKNYDYSQNGAYFVTICAKNHNELFGKFVVGATDPVARNTTPGCPAAPSRIELTELGKCVDASINIANNDKNGIKIDAYVIMPNHIHLIVVISSKTGDRGRSPLQDVIRNIKSYASKTAGGTVWQKSFHDHIIRHDDDYNRIVEYIVNNPAKWLEDRYYEGDG